MPITQTPSPKRLADLKATILRPATTSNFQCWFNPPREVRNWLANRQSAGLLPKNYIGNEEFYSLSCSEASLPGSTFATHQMTNDHSGVTERHAYRRLYDDRAEFSFYVDHGYNPILLFENWMAYIANEQRTNEGAGYSSINDDIGYSYRMNFPKGETGYQTTIYINKFEKDYAGRYLQYKFLNAFPISINTMPLSYNASELLKCTVSFTYSRYVTENPSANPNTLERQQNFERELSQTTDSRVTGTTNEGLAGAGTIRGLNRINRGGSGVPITLPGLGGVAT